MPAYDLNDTITAIATPIGEGGIGIVRLSGKDALKIADKVFTSRGKKSPCGFKSYTTHYGWIKDKEKIIDEVILTVMLSPYSYTKEDVVEINCHGGIVALRAVLDLVLASGSRLAEPGEFTKRAFLNGRIDLVQAEAVLDIIRAKTDAALKTGLAQLQGNLSRDINKSRESLLEIASLLEANIDFPDEELGRVDLKEVAVRLSVVDSALKKLLSSSRQGRIMRDGLHVVICGKPNVGKSSLLNALLKQERSIVTALAGTTRDTIEEIIDIRGIPVRIVDTAGIMKAAGIIEKKAISRSKKHIEAADLVLLVFDASKKLSKEDLLLIRKLKKRTVIAVVNKIDVSRKIEKEKITALFNNTVFICAKKMHNIDLLEDAISGLVYEGKVSSPQSVLVTNLRHLESLRQAENLIAHALDSLDNSLSIEFISQDIKEALSFLDDIMGRRFNEDMLDKIFSEFCIGK